MKMNIRKIIILFLVFFICVILHKCYTLHTNNREDFSDAAAAAEKEKEAFDAWDNLFAEFTASPLFTETDTDANLNLWAGDLFPDFTVQFNEVMLLFTVAKDLYDGVGDNTGSAAMVQYIDDHKASWVGWTVIHKTSRYTIKINEQVTKSSDEEAVLKEITNKMLKPGTPTVIELDVHKGKLTTARSNLDSIISDLGDIKLKIDADGLLYELDDIKTLYDTELSKIKQLKTGITEQIATIVSEMAAARLRSLKLFGGDVAGTGTGTGAAAAEAAAEAALAAFDKLEADIDAEGLLTTKTYEDWDSQLFSAFTVRKENVVRLYTVAKKLYAAVTDTSKVADLTSKVADLTSKINEINGTWVYLTGLEKTATYTIKINEQVTKSSAAEAVLDEIKTKMQKLTPPPTLIELDGHHEKLKAAGLNLVSINNELGDIKSSINADGLLYELDELEELYEQELIKINQLNMDIQGQIYTIVTAKSGINAGTNLSPQLAQMKTLLEGQLTPILTKIDEIKESQSDIKATKLKSISNNKLAKAREETERLRVKALEVTNAREKHDALIEQIEGLEESLKNEIGKGSDADVRVIKSVGKMLTNQTDELSELNNNKSDDPKLKALHDKVHESHNLLKSQTNQLTKLLSQPKTENTSMEINKLKNSMLAVEKVMENQTMNISNTVKKSQNNELSKLALMGQMTPMSTQMPMLPMSYSSNSNIDNSHHNKLNSIIESIEKLNPKTMNDKEFERLKPRLNQLDNLDKEKLLGLLDSTLAVDVNSNNSKDLQDIVSYTKKLIASKSNLNSYNTNENNILLQEFKTAIRNKTLRKLTKYDRDILMSTPDSQLWKQIIYLNKKYSDQNPYDTTYVPGYVYMPPDKWETRREIPKCINDKAPISSPAFVFGSGVPRNALEFDSKLLPRFSYREEGSGVFTDDEKFNKEYTNSIMEETDRERLVLSTSNTDKYVEKVRTQHSKNHRFDDYNL